MSSSGTPSCQLISEALVREYLTKNGLVQTLDAFQNERPKSAGSITKRDALRQSLALDRQFARLKKQQPEKAASITTLEMWVEYQCAKLAISRSQDGVVPQAATTSMDTMPILLPDAPKFSGRNTAPRAEQVDTMMVVEDVDDVDEASSVMPTTTAGRISSQGPLTRAAGEPLPPEAGRQLKKMLWGTGGQPPGGWQQGFFFNATGGLAFGLVQLQGGPCGVLAAVQAHVLAQLQLPGQGGFNCEPSRQEQQDALVAALAATVWQAQQDSSACVACCSQAGPMAGVTFDQLLRVTVMHQAASLAAVQDHIRRNLLQYTERDGWGIVLLLLSVLLTHGLPATTSDMDDPTTPLTAIYGYCTQELVNLLLTGRAVSNVFDGVRQLDGEAVLKGVQRRSRLGLLTLFEWYKYVEVGRHLKEPEVPVWVVCSESHFTVVFATDGRAAGGQLPFDLVYYDGLANQEARVVLSLITSAEGGWTAKVGDTMGDRGRWNGENIPPLECVLETKWPGVEVDWNGTEPVL